MRRVLRLVLAAQAGSDLDGQPAQDFALGIDQEPALFDLAYLRGIGFHAGIAWKCGKAADFTQKNGATRESCAESTKGGGGWRRIQPKPFTCNA
jgi:hypothetical protein